MSELLAVGRSIIEVLNGPWEGLERLPELLDTRDRLIGEISSLTQAQELVQQDRQLVALSLSLYRRLRCQLRYQRESISPTPKFYDQRS